MTVEDAVDVIYDLEITQFFLCVMVMDEHPYFYDVTRRQAYQVVSYYSRGTFVNVRVDGNSVYIG